MTTVISLSCNHCGAPLEVPEGTRFLTCSHCGSRLAVQRSGAAAYTQVLEELGETARGMAEDLDAIRLQGELEALERDFERQERRLMIRDKHGELHRPGTASSVMAVAAILFGIFWMAAAFTITADSPFWMGKVFPWFGLVFIGGAVWSLVSSQDKARRLRELEAEHRRRREELRRRMRA